MAEDRTYVAIDLKSFYASVECVERGLDPLGVNLVVADPERTEKTICLAVSPTLKAYGISGRARLFEVVQRVNEVNAVRKRRAPGGEFSGGSYLDAGLRADPSLAVSYIVAPPRMAKYMEVSTRIHEIYLRYVAPEDIFVYSIDEVFLDVTAYLRLYGLTAHDLTAKIIRDVLAETGITATAGIGTNLYLCKVAMDIVAKHVPADADGVRIAGLDEMSYRRTLWTHRPITDFWRVGPRYAARLEKYGVYTMGDVALLSCTQEGEDLLYREFGVNAELLIDHAWGFEPCTMAAVHAHRPEDKSISSGQILPVPYEAGMAKLVVREMTELLVLELVDRGFLTDQLVLTVGYDTENLKDEARRGSCHGEITADRYGRRVPRAAHGTARLKQPTSSTRLIVDAVMKLFEQIVNPALLVRRMNIAAGGLKTADSLAAEPVMEQLDLFTDYEALARERADERERLEKEKRMQQASLAIRKKFGKNAILKGTNLQEGATARQRNRTVGGHRA